MNDIRSKTPDQWRELHLQIQDMLAGYVDQELDAAEQRAVEAHLAGCAACRQDVARQRLLHQRLMQLPAQPLSSEQHRSLDRMLQDAPPNASPPSRRFRWRRFWPGDMNKSHLLAGSGWALALILLTVSLWPTAPWMGNHPIPMVQDVLHEYAQVARDTLRKPGRQAGIAPPVTWPKARILTSWMTSVGGDAAQAYALRNGNSVILQFRVSDDVFFNDPKIRAAVANKGQYEVRQNNLRVLALPLDKGGLLLVGPDRSMPPRGELRLVREGI